MRFHLTDFVPPAKYSALLTHRHDVRNILDVGCARNSPRQARRWFPNASYSAIDIDARNNSPQVDHFYHLDLDRDHLEVIPDRQFDLIIFSHVIEHLHYGEAAIRSLARKLTPNGTLYIETPSERSIHFPSAVGTLNFYDDPTHVRLYTHAELANAVAESGLQIVSGGTARSAAWMALAATVLLPLHVKALFQHGRLFGPGLWDWLGFREFIVAVLPTAVPSHGDAQQSHQRGA